MKTIIAGSRDITDREVVKNAIEKAIKRGFDITEVVSGTADGVDTIGEEWAENNDVNLSRFPYEEHLDDNPPEVAPIIRNNKMAEYAEQAIIVWDGKSNGTKDMIETARNKDLDLHVERTDNSTLADF